MKISTVQIIHPKFDGIVIVNKGSKLHLEGKEVTEEEVLASYQDKKLPPAFDYHKLSKPQLREHAEKAGLPKYVVRTKSAKDLIALLESSTYQPE